MKKNDIKVCLAQMKVIPGQPAENTKKMLKIIKNAKSEKVDLIIFPELCVPGYIIGDMWERQSFLEECNDSTLKIIKESEGIAVAFGNVTYDTTEKNEDGRVRKYNTCLVVKDQAVVQISDKTLQPNYRMFDDNRHFYDRKKRLTDAIYDQMETNSVVKTIFDSNYYSIEIKGFKIGFLICEDSWDTDYTFSPISVLAKKSDIIVNISCSPFTMGKNDKRDRVFSEHSKNNNVDIIYVNNVGSQNNGKTIYTFDGDSCIYSKNGVKINLYNDFEEGFKSVKLIDFIKNHKSAKQPKKDIKKLYDCLSYGIKEFLGQTGIEKIIIGASGGIDSAVVASLFYLNMRNPKDNLYLINMPSKFNSTMTKDLAAMLANNMNCKYSVIPIEKSVNDTKEQLSEFGFDVNDYCFENIQARDRSARILAGIASSVGGAFTCNANKSEMTVGYTTMYGDLGGFLAPLADVWKTDVYKLANYINELCGRHIIPSGSINITPSAELSESHNVEQGKGDPIVYEYHDCLFKSWVERWNRLTPKDILYFVKNDSLEEELNFNNGKIIEKCFRNDMRLFIDDLEKWWNLFDGFAYAKRIQAPPVIAVSRRSYGFDLRESQTSPFYSQKYYELKADLLDY